MKESEIGLREIGDGKVRG